MTPLLGLFCRLLQVVLGLSAPSRSASRGAYDKRGTGSKFVCARIIGDQICGPAAPLPDVSSVPDRDQFLQETIAVVA